MFILNKKRINIHAPFTTDNGIQYANLLSEDVRKILGVKEIPDPTIPEDYTVETYYRVEQDEAPYVVYTKKSEEQLQQIQQNKINQAALDYLNSTDWYVTRFTETAVAIPEEIKAKRQAARDSIVRPEV